MCKSTLVYQSKVASRAQKQAPGETSRHGHARKTHPNKHAHRIQTTCRYLDALSDGALQLRLSMDGDRVVKRARARAADGGFRDRSLSQLSGGQWRRASLSLELAFVELARQRGRFSCNLLVLDEVLSQLDSYGRERVSLRSLFLCFVLACLFVVVKFFVFCLLLLLWCRVVLFLALRVFCLVLDFCFVFFCVFSRVR